MTVDDLSALADATAAATGGAVAFMHPQGHVVAYSSLPGQAIDDVRRDGILGKRVPDKFLVHRHYPEYRTALYVEMLPAAVRFSGASVGYAIGTILGGAFVPTIAEALFEGTGSSLSIRSTSWHCPPSRLLRPPGSKTVATSISTSDDQLR
ncbi:hypothetical protein [Rhodococcus sp. 27YEA15]|uniref:hypothetical protein n=1 Tax=Rhodococcus sp. 27YEA15 TaxID=3156259 RepID=UPI003C7C3A49